MSASASRLSFSCWFWALMIEIRALCCKSNSLARKPRKLAPALMSWALWPSLLHYTIPNLDQNTPCSVKYSSSFWVPLTKSFELSNAKTEWAPCRCQNITTCSKLWVQLALRLRKGRAVLVSPCRCATKIYDLWFLALNWSVWLWFRSTTCSKLAYCGLDGRNVLTIVVF